MQKTCATLYCLLWLVRLCNDFSHYLINDTIVERTLLNTKYVFSFPLQYLSEIFLILIRIERDMNKNVYWSLYKVLFILVRF